MTTRTASAVLLIVLAMAFVAVGTGASWHDGSQRKLGGSTELPPVDAGEHPAPLALVGDRAVGLPDLAPALLEAAGAQVLGDWVLDRELARRLAGAGLSISDADVRRERDLLADALGLAGLTPDDAQRAIERERAARGLGPVRFESLLRRSAMLRALAARDLRPGEDLIEQAYRTRFGERLELRLLVADDPARAEEIRGQLVAVEMGTARDLAFAERALRESVDSTAAAGGLLEPLSAADSRYPEVIRGAADALKPGEISPVITLGTRGAIVYLRARRPAEAAPPREQVREELASQLLVGLQRRAMDELAGKIRREVGVLVMDRALGWSWDRRADAAGGAGGADQPPGR